MRSHFPAWLCVLVLGGVCLCTASCAFAGVANQPNFIIRTWQTEQGLPQDSVNALCQTSDGYLWLGTFNGLVRFDGVRFAVFDTGNAPQLQTSRITSLFEDTRHRLWIGHETGDVTRYEAGQFHPVSLSEQKNLGAALAFGEDQEGEIWLLDDHGILLRLRDGLSFPPSKEVSLAGSTIGFVTDRAGMLWALRSGELSALRNDQPVPADLSGQATHFAKAVCASRRGGLWVLIEFHVRRWVDGHWAEDLGRLPVGQRLVTTLVETPAGAVAVGTEGNGLYVFDPNGALSHFNRSNGLSDDWVRSLANDSEGNLWVGTGNGGLNELRPGKVWEAVPPDGWQQRAVLSVASGRSNDLWIGTEGAGLYHLQSGTWQHFGAEAGLSNLFVWSVLETSGGQLWLGTWGGGLLRRSGQGFSAPTGLENVTTPITALCEDKQGALWAGAGAGLLRWFGGRAEWYGREQGFALANVRAIATDTQGAVWCGMSGGGLCCLSNEGVKHFHKADGLPSEFVLSLRFSTDGTLWIGTFGGGLGRLKDGRFATIGTQQGLPNNVILSIEEDSLGYFWLGSHAGVLRVARVALERCADGLATNVRCLVYNRSDGLPTLECSGGFQPVVGHTSDGRLWFPTRKGLVGLAPDGVRTNGLPPRVLLEEVLVEGRAVNLFTNPTANGQLRIPPGESRIEFHYTGLCFAAPEKVRFRHRLEGLEADWVETGFNRTANYSYLPPGDYSFQVTACKEDGLWNGEGASLNLKVLPHFWQTWWFRSLCGALALAAPAAAVLLGARRRMRAKLERLKRQQAIERERARIARDIHDDLGANLTRITMLSQSAHDEPNLPPPTAAYLLQIDQTARDLTRAMDEIVWAINPKHDSLNSLAGYFGKFAQDFLRSAGIACRLEVPFQLPPLPLTAESRHNLFLAFKEALNNVVKHAAATEVSVSLQPDTNGFTLLIRDNGRGFEIRDLHTNDGAARNGLSNMRRRLEKIGGNCTIISHRGTGTEVRFAFKTQAVSAARLPGAPSSDEIKTDDFSIPVS